MWSHYSAHRPDFSIFNKLKNLIILVDVLMKGLLRRSRRRSLNIRTWLNAYGERKQKIIPVVIGTLGAVSTHCKDWFERNKCIHSTKVSNTLLGTVSTLRKTLQLSSADCRLYSSLSFCKMWFIQNNKLYRVQGIFFM